MRAILCTTSSRTRRRVTQRVRASTDLAASGGSYRHQAQPSTDPPRPIGTAFRDAAQFEEWLGAHVDLKAGVWLKIAKAGSGIPSLTSDEAVDVGLCYGWISGQRKSLDEVYYLQKYVPRRPRGRWSQVNVAKVEDLIAAGRMRPSGFAQVQGPKSHGRWAGAYTAQRDAAV